MDRLSPEREAEIREGIHNTDHYTMGAFFEAAAEDLLAELDAVRRERDDWKLHFEILGEHNENLMSMAKEVERLRGENKLLFAGELIWHRTADSPPTEGVEFVVPGYKHRRKGKLWQCKEQFGWVSLVGDKPTHWAFPPSEDK